MTEIIVGGATLLLIALAAHLYIYFGACRSNGDAARRYYQSIAVAGALVLVPATLVSAVQF